MATIIINGKTYNSLDEVPPDERKMYESLLGSVFADADHDGVPDVLQAQGNAQVIAVQQK